MHLVELKDSLDTALRDVFNSSNLPQDAANTVSCCDVDYEMSEDDKLIATVFLTLDNSSAKNRLNLLHRIRQSLLSLSWELIGTDSDKLSDSSVHITLEFQYNSTPAKENLGANTASPASAMGLAGKLSNPMKPKKATECFDITNGQFESIKELYEAYVNLGSQLEKLLAQGRASLYRTSPVTPQKRNIEPAQTYTNESEDLLEETGDSDAIPQSVLDELSLLEE